MSEQKQKRSEIRNKISIRDGKLNLTMLWYFTTIFIGFYYFMVQYEKVYILMNS